MQFNYITIESLESRIAPASVITYTDVDGDHVIIKSSKGDLDGHATFASIGGGQQLLKLDLKDDSFANTNLTVKVERVAGGDGLANIGFIDAADNDLGRIVIKGDLGRIVAGDANEGTRAIKLLRVHSMGQLGTTTQGGAVGGGELSAGIIGLVDDLLGIRNDTGLLDDITSTISDLLNGGTLDDPTNTISRTLLSLQLNLESLLDLSRTPDELPNGTLGLLNNVAILVSDLLGSSSGGSSVIGSLLTGQLLEVDGKLDTLLGQLLPDINVSIDVKNLLGLDLNALLGINLGGLGFSVGGLLQNLGAVVENLLGQPQFGQLPQNIQNLVQEADDHLASVLDGTAPLTDTVAGLLAQLQTETVGILGIARHAEDVLTPLLQDLLYNIDGLITNLLGGENAANADGVSLSSDIRGDVGAIQVSRNVSDVFLNIQGDLRKIIIRGGLTGGEFVNGGQLLVTGDLGSLFIGRELVGGMEANSGSIVCDGQVGRMTIKGAILGGEGTHSGTISLGSDLKKLEIRRDVVGGDGVFSGAVINENGGIKKVLVRGSLVAGEGDSSGTLRVSEDIAQLRIGRSIVGDAAHRVEITAGGLETKHDAKNRALGRIYIGGSVQFADMLAGYGTALDAVNGDAQIGKLKVQHDWIASNLSAGVLSASDTNLSGAQSYTIISTGNTDIVSRIAAVRINGSVVGTQAGGDQYAFVAEHIGKFVINKTKMPLISGANNDIQPLSQTTGDVTVREVGAVLQN